MKVAWQLLGIALIVTPSTVLVLHALRSDGWSWLHIAKGALVFFAALAPMVIGTLLIGGELP